MYSEKPKLHKKQKLHKPGELRTISLDVTSRCNMNCAHCYAKTFMDTHPVDLNILKPVLDEARRLGAFHYVLQGGEPTEDIERLTAIIGMCYPDETYINVITNGWNLDRAMIDKLKTLKVDKLTFSLDSGIEEEHDQNRRPGSFKKVMSAIDIVLKEGLLASISVVVTKQSLYSEGFKKAYEFAGRKDIRIDVQIAEPVGGWDGETEHLMRKEDSRHIKVLRESSPILKNGQKMVNRDIFTGQADHCPAGSEFLAITANGNILPCNFLQFTIGNIRDNSLDKARTALMVLKWFNGTYPVCPCGEDGEFINKFIKPYISEQKPLNAFEVFGLKQQKKESIQCTMT